MNSINPISASQASMLAEMERMKVGASNGGAQTQEVSGSAFSQMVVKAATATNQAQLHSDDVATRFLMGDPTVTVADVTAASQNASLALEATNQVKNKLVSALSDVLNTTF